MKTVAFTGYRPQKLSFAESNEDLNYVRFRRIQKNVINRLVQLGYMRFVSGMAMGFDTWVSEDVCELKKENKNIELVCAVPFPNQAKSWSDEDKARYERLKAEADQVEILSEGYTRFCYHKRDRYMVDNADVVVCCFDGKPGGTAYTVDYAMKKGKTVIQINPTDFTVSVFGEV